ncbi:MAG: DNA gyrase inhibitor YacG [Myxococcaceae bacterium]|nr:DNA gyrase inhibitor YacG [Myxococcaceae bacterium]
MRFSYRAPDAWQSPFKVRDDRAKNAFVTARCPSCQQAALPRLENPFFPFCSRRCKAVDLGRWLGGEFRIADESADADEDGALATAGVIYEEEP